MGKSDPIETQRFSESPPKPASGGRWARAASTIASSFFGTLLFAGTAAAEKYWVQDAYGDWYLVDTGPDPALILILLLIIIGIGCVIAMAIDEEEKKGQARAAAASAANLPAEIASPQTVAHYEDQTARVLAYDRYLRAQADQYRRYIETARLEAEAHEVARLLEDHRANRRRGQ